MTTGRLSPDDRPEAAPAPTPSPLGAMPDAPVTHERVMTELAAMEVAHEELQVAEEEMRVQQEQITQLLLQHDAERRWRGQLSALVPVGLCVTDGNGALLDANPALATHFGTGLHRLRGKPMSVFVEPEDVPRFRAALRTLSSGTNSEERLTLGIRPRDRPPARAHLFGFSDRSDHRPSAARVQWILVSGEPAEGSVDPALDADVPAAVPPADEGAQPGSPAQMLKLAAALSELSALPVGEPDRQRLLSRMAVLVKGAVPGAEWVSITIGSPLEPQRLGSDSTEAQDFDGRQVRAGEGPCLAAYDTRSVVVTDDVTSDPRWPALARIAGTSAVRSVLALPVQEEGTATGAVNVYSSQAGSFGRADRLIAELTTAAVASVLQTVAERESIQKLADNLERALSSRAVIDQAKGMIMAMLGVDAEEAFARMVNLSSRLNVKVRDLAGLIVSGHVDAILRAAD